MTEPVPRTISPGPHREPRRSSKARADTAASAAMLQVEGWTPLPAVAVSAGISSVPVCDNVGAADDLATANWGAQEDFDEAYFSSRVPLELEGLSLDYVAPPKSSCDTPASAAAAAPAALIVPPDDTVQQ